MSSLLMPKSYRRQRDKEFPPFDPDEVWNQPSMRGMLSVLEPDPPEWAERRKVFAEQQRETARRLGMAAEITADSTVEEVVLPPEGLTVEPSPAPSNGSPEGPSEMSTVDILDMSTVGQLDRPTVDNCNLSTVDIYPDVIARKGPHSTEQPYLSTVDITVEPTVDISNPSTVDISSEFELTATEMSTVDISKPTILDGYSWFLPSADRDAVQARLVRRITTVQDVMSRIELEYYRLLWNATEADGLTVLQKNDQVKLFQAGYKALMTLLDIEKRHVPRVLASLEAKFAIEVQTCGGSPGQGRVCSTYRLYSMRMILSRVRDAGWGYAAKIGKTVCFVKPVKLTDSGMTTVDIYKKTTVDNSEKSTVDNCVNVHGGKNVYRSHMSTVDGGHLPGASLLGLVSYSNDDDVAVENLERSILETVHRDFDRQAIRQIWRQSREAVPDITPEEVFLLFKQKADTLCRNRRVENFNGMLLWSWGGVVTQNRVEQLRADKREAEEAAERQRQETLAMYREWLTDPSVPENWKKDAEEALAAEESKAKGAHT